MSHRKHRAQHSEDAGLQCRPGAEMWQEYDQWKRTLFSASKLTYQGQSSAFISSSKQNSSVGWNACLVIQVAGYTGDSKNFISTWSMQAKYTHNSGDRLPIYYQVQESILYLILLNNIQRWVPEQSFMGYKFFENSNLSKCILFPYFIDNLAGYMILG